MSHDYSERLVDTDLVGRLQPYVDNKIFNYYFMGDEWINFHSGSETNTPWLIHKGVHGNHCHLYQTIYCNVFNCVPQHCFKHCWKITACSKGMEDDVVKQLTMEEVMKIRGVQQRLDFPSKVGMDKRTFTPTIWGAFWYFGSLGHARSQYDRIASEIHECVHPDIEVNIKRSCTEFELMLGPSNKWDDLELHWGEKESVLDQWVYKNDQPPKNQHELIQRATKIKMLYWAHQHGDMTYKRFNRGNDLVHTLQEEKRVPIQPSVTYNP